METMVSVLCLLCIYRQIDTNNISTYNSNLSKLCPFTLQLKGTDFFYNCLNFFQNDLNTTVITWFIGYSYRSKTRYMLDCILKNKTTQHILLPQYECRCIVRQRHLLWITLAVFTHWCLQADNKELQDRHCTQVTVSGISSTLVFK